MTVNTTTNRARYVGNGATTVFTYDFIIPDATELQLWYTDVAGTTTEISSALYTVTGINDPNGGTVTYLPGGVAAPVGSVVVILRIIPYTQPVDLINQDGFYPQVVEDALDNLEMQIQQIIEVEGRNLTVGVTDTSPGELPSAAERANQLLGFDADGNAIAAQPSSATVSTAMQPVVAAATLAAGRTAFGLGTAAVEGIGSGLQDDGAANIRTFYKIIQDAGNKTVDVTYHAQQHLATGAISYSMPKASTLFNGFGFWISALTAAVTININAADNFPGMASGASLILSPGMQVFVATDAAASGLWSASFEQLPGFDSPLNLQINAAVATSALTVSIKDRNGLDPTTASPVLLAFRDPTATGGGIFIRALTSALSITVPNTATLGTTSGQAFRLWVVVFDNAGTLVLGTILASTSTSFKSLDETTAVSGTAVIAGSNTAQTFYTASAVTTKSFRVLGFIEFNAGQVTAGTWLAAPSKIQVFGAGVKKPGDLIQRARTTLGTVATGTTAIPNDNTIPQITEGDQYITQVVTPFATMNVLEVKGQIFFSVAANNAIVALFQDAIANALAVADMLATSANALTVGIISYSMISSSVAALTFRLRVGGASGTTTVNGQATAQFMGGVMNSYLEVSEYMG